MILTQYYPPEIGAPQARLAFLAGVLRDRGHDVTVLTAMPNYPEGRVRPGYGGWSCREDIDDAVVWRTYIRPSPRLAMVPRMAAYLSFAASSLVVGLRRVRGVDIVLVESPPLVLGPTAIALARAWRARLVFNVSDLWPDSAIRLGMLGPGRALRTAEWLEGFCYRHAWVVSGQSPGIVQSIRDRFPGTDVELLSNGVDVDLFTPRARSRDLRELLGGDGRTIVLYAGLHGRAQGLDAVIAAAARLDDADVTFAFVGDGPDKAALVERATSLGLRNVRFLGSRPRAEMPDLVASADIAVIPLSVQLPGAVPSKLYEAMGAGVPVVLAADGEPARVVEGAACGITTSSGDAAGIAAAVERLAASPELRATMGRSGRQAALTRFDRRKATHAFVESLERRLSVS